MGEIKYKLVRQPLDDELQCDECDADVLASGCYTAEIDGYGASGIRVICPACHTVYDSLTEEQ